MHWDDRCTHFGVFEDANANRWHSDGAVLPVYSSPGDIPGAEDPGIELLASVEHEIDYLPGTRRAGHARIALVHADGRRDDVDLEPLLCFRMKGIGYMHPEWGHGMWKGELAYAGESWKVDDLDPMAFENQHLQQVVRATCGDEVGVGVLRADRLRSPRPLRLQGAPRPCVSLPEGEPASANGSETTLATPVRVEGQSSRLMVRFRAARVARTAPSTGVAPSATPRRWMRARGSVTDATTRKRRSGVVSTVRAQPGR